MIMFGADVVSSYTHTTTRGNASSSTPERRLLNLALDHASELFAERGLTFSNHSAHHPHTYNAFGIFKRAYKSDLRLRVEPMILRAAFSNVHVWSALMADMSIMSMVSGHCRHGCMCGNNIVTVNTHVHTCAVCLGTVKWLTGAVSS